MRVAILDDYQGVSQQFIDIEKLSKLGLLANGQWSLDQNKLTFDLFWTNLFHRQLFYIHLIMHSLM